MRTPFVIVVAIFLLVSSCHCVGAQTRVWTNADLGRPVAQWEPRKVHPQELGWLEAHVYVPPPAPGDGPHIYVIGTGRPTLGPWEFPPEAFEPPAPLSRDPYIYFPPFMPWYWPGQPLLATPPQPPHIHERRDQK